MAKIRLIRIEPADSGGFVAEVEYRSEKRGKSGLSYIESTKHVFTTSAEVMAFLDDQMPSARSVQSKGKSKSRKDGHIREDSYEGSH